MKIGIKYCGGCNPRYDRGSLMSDLRATFGERHLFEVAREEGVYEALIVLGGCTSCCAKHDHLSITGETFFVKGPSDYEALVRWVSQMASN